MWVKLPLQLYNKLERGKDTFVVERIKFIFIFTLFILF